MKKLTKCPHCGSDEGLYTKTVYRNVVYRFEYDGEEQDNTEMFESAELSGGNMMYCQMCDKPVCRRSTFEAAIAAQEGEADEKMQIPEN